MNSIRNSDVYTSARLHVYTVLSCLLTFVYCIPVIAQQQCNDAIDYGTPTARFLDNGDGTATDMRTRLRWQRCAVGYAFSDNGTPSLADDSCTPSLATTFTWQQALQDTVTYNLQGGLSGITDWRLPNARELISIVETKCSGPAINEQIFPSTPVTAEFFTATPANVGTSDTAIVTVDFTDGADGSVVLSAGSGSAPTRYVRRVRVENRPF